MSRMKLAIVATTLDKNGNLSEHTVQLLPSHPKSQGLDDLVDAQFALRMAGETNKWLQRPEPSLVGFYVYDPQTGKTMHVRHVYDVLFEAGKEVVTHCDWLVDDQSQPRKQHRQNGWGKIVEPDESGAFLVQHLDGTQALYMPKELYTRSGQWFGHLSQRWLPVSELEVA